MKQLFIVLLVIGFIAANLYFAVKTKVLTLPASFPSVASVKGVPSDFPIYGGAKVLGADTSNAKKPSYSWQTPDDVGKVTDWYVSSLKAGGWDITIPPSAANTYKNTATNLEARKDTHILQLSVIKESSGTKIVAELPDPSMFTEQEDVH